MTGGRGEKLYTEHLLLLRSRLPYLCETVMCNMKELLRRIWNVAIAMKTQGYTSKQLRKPKTKYGSEFALDAGSDGF